MKFKGVGMLRIRKKRVIFVNGFYETDEQHVIDKLKSLGYEAVEELVSQETPIAKPKKGKVKK